MADALDALWDTSAPSPPMGPSRAPSRPMGSVDSIGVAPAGEAEAPAGDALDALWGAPPPPTALDTAKKIGGAVVNMVTGDDRKTKETESLPDFNYMPEMRQALISNTIPAVGSLSGPPVVAIESLARHLSLDAPGLGLPAAVKNMWANTKTSLGTTMASAAEQVKAIVANNPDVKLRQDEKGNTILKSAQNGKEYIVPPGISFTDAPRIAQGMAAAVPAATAGPAVVAGRTLGPIASKALAGGIGAALTEGAQSIGGGEFNLETIPIAAGANVVGPALSAGKSAVVKALSGGAEQEAKNAALRAAAQARTAAGAAPQSFNDVVAPVKDVAAKIAALTPKQQAAVKMVPLIGDWLHKGVELAKLLDEGAEAGAKKIPKEVRDVLDDVLRDPNVVGVGEDIGERGAVSSGLELDRSLPKRAPPPAPDPFAAARARGDALEAARPTESMSAVDPSATRTPTPTPKARSGPKPAPAPSAFPGDSAVYADAGAGKGEVLSREQWLEMKMAEALRSPQQFNPSVAAARKQASEGLRGPTKGGLQRMGEQVAAEAETTAKALAQPAAKPATPIADAQVQEAADFIRSIESDTEKAAYLAAVRMKFGPEASKKLLQALGMWQ